MSDELDIVLPVFNEGSNIAPMLDEIEKKVKSLHTISIIYDFDEDNTLPAARQYILDNRKTNINLKKNTYGRGVLNAIKFGLLNSEGQALLVTMADLSDEMSVVDLMREKMNQGYDIVCGSRYMRGGGQIGGPRVKKILSRMAGLSLHFLTGIPTHDISNSFKMYRTSLLKNIQIESSGGFEIGLEILVKSYLSGAKITEVPTTWRDRQSGKSNFKLMQWLPNYLRWYFLALRWKVSLIFTKNSGSKK